ncbi:MAG: 30S ribosomal protein S20 [Bacillota bacterium]|nr:30S ribosomal protein S20 [Bacillota bacterium]
MPQIKSQKKRVLTNNKAHKMVVSKKSELKTAIKKVLAAVEAQDKEAAVAAYNTCCSKLDKAVAKGIHHKNYAARQKSRLATAVNSIA